MRRGGDLTLVNVAASRRTAGVGQVVPIPRIIALLSAALISPYISPYLIHTTSSSRDGRFVGHPTPSITVTPEPARPIS